MASITHGLGKGLREPTSPYREAYFFGAELNEPDASNWNAIPRIVEPTTLFDLSALTEGHEVAVALLAVDNARGGRHYFRAEWYRERDNKRIYDFSWSADVQSGGWVYFYSYIGYVPWEISENGAYRVELSITGAETYSQILPFAVTGISGEDAGEEAPEGALPVIIAALNGATAFIWSIGVELMGWVYPFNLISGPFFNLAYAFNDLAWGFYYFSNWVVWVGGEVLDILSPTGVRLLILGWLPDIESAVAWWADRLVQVASIIDEWWNTSRTTVHGWIDAAGDVLQSQIDGLSARVGNIQGWVAELLLSLPDVSEVLSWFSDWWGKISEKLEIWWNGKIAEVQPLIESTIKVWFPFYESLAQLWGSVATFITNPLDWLEEKFTDWFLGPEE